MKSLSSLSFAIAFLVSGCLTTSYEGIEPKPALEGNWKSVQVVSIGQIKRPYNIIGSIKGDAAIYKIVKFKKKAATLGGDAITLPERYSNALVQSQIIRYTD